MEERKNLAEYVKTINKLHNLGDRKEEDLTEKDFDFQGWLIPHITLGEMLLSFGFRMDEENNKIYMDLDDPTLTKFPTIYQDDGMGYGANNGKLTHASIGSDNELSIWF